MNFMLITPSYAFKKKLCLKRIQKRALAKYKECVQEIIQNGEVKINGNSFTSIADLTMAFYGTNNSNITSSYLPDLNSKSKSKKDVVRSGWKEE